MSEIFLKFKIFPQISALPFDPHKAFRSWGQAGLERVPSAGRAWGPAGVMPFLGSGRQVSSPHPVQHLGDRGRALARLSVHVGLFGNVTSQLMTLTPKVAGLLWQARSPTREMALLSPPRWLAVTSVLGWMVTVSLISSLLPGWPPAQDGLTRGFKGQ
jgi:hypothetical protein